MDILSLSLSSWLMASGIIFLAATLQGIIGYGVGVFGVPLLYLVYPAFVPAPMIMIGMLLPMMILQRDFRAVQRQDVLWALPGMAIGIGLAAQIIHHISQQQLGYFLGSIVLLGVALSMFRSPALPGKGTLSLASGLSGFMGTITAIGGPPLALVFQRMHGQRLRGTLSAIFVPAGLMSLAALYGAGRLGIKEAMLALALLPGMLAGFWFSGQLNQRIRADTLNTMVLSVSALAGFFILYRSMTGH